MRLSQEVGRQNQSPEYRQALQELIKYEIQALIERLSATGEEAFILTASISDGTSTQLGSQKGEGFLLKQSELSQNFLSFCSEEGINSSADELGSFCDDNSSTLQKDTNPVVSSVSYPPRRSRDRISITEDRPAGNLYEVTPASVIYAAERNDSASSVSSFVAATQEDENDLQCKICSRNFRSYKTLSQHVRLHVAKSYKCGVCGKMFSVKKRYQRHMKSHNNYKMLECGICDKSFWDQYSWKKHRELHLEDRNFSCNLCGKAFFEKYSLRVHQTSHFSSPSKTDKSIDSTAGYSCHICQKISKTKTAMKTHLLTHSAKKHVCEFCNKRFSLRYSYVRHRRIHTGEKPYKCGSCDKSFSDGSAWAKHVRTHSGIKPYSCTTCSKSFFDKTTCKTHMKSHQNKRQVRLADQDKRNFEDISTEKPSSVSGKKTEMKSAKLTFDLSDSESQLFDNEELGRELGLHLEDSNGKGFADENLLDSDLGNDGGHKMTSDDVDEKEILEPLLDSVQLDDMFQKDFVERNMPSKALESDNEFITDNFPDILTDDNEVANQPEIEKDFSLPEPPEFHESKGFLESSSQKHVAKLSTRSRSKFFFDSPVSKCKKCHKTFKTELQLRQHQQFKCMMKLYKCRYCGKQLSTQNSLVRHERIHVGNRPYQCNICQKSFADNYGCIRHIKHHFTNDNKSRTASSSPENHSVSPSSVGNLSLTSTSDSTVTEIKSENLFVQSSTEPQTSPVQSRSPGYVADQPNTPSTQCLITESPTDGVSDFANSQYNNVSSTPSASLASPEGLKSPESKKQCLFKCSLCAALFSTHEACLTHVQEHCALMTKTAQSLPQTTYTNLPTSTSSNELNNLFQCSLCLQIFADKSACQDHIDNSCSKTTTDADTKSAVDSILTDNLTYSDLTHPVATSPVPPPKLEIQSAESFLDIPSGQVVLLSESFVNSAGSNTNEVSDVVSSSSGSQTSSSNQSSSAYIKLTSQPALCHISSKSLEGGNSDGTFTNVVQKPVMSLGKFVITNKGLSLVEPSVLKPVTKSDKTKKGESDISERTCLICDKIFTTKHILKQHTLIHMDKKFGCKFCMKKFHNKYGRDRHERIHTGEKPFSCPNCKKAFSDNSTYRKHTRVCCSVK